MGLPKAKSPKISFKMGNRIEEKEEESISCLKLESQLDISRSSSLLSSKWFKPKMAWNQ
jgi:hypothetical protein